MKILIAFGFVFLISIKIQAATLYIDTTQPGKPSEISQQQFLEKYGSDDTAGTIINYFFLQRAKAHRRIIPSSIAFGIGIFITAVAANMQQYLE